MWTEFLTGGEEWSKIEIYPENAGYLRYEGSFYVKTPISTRHTIVFIKKLLEKIRKRRILVLAVAAAAVIFIGTGGLTESNEIVEEIERNSTFYSKLSALRPSVEGALLFLNGSTPTSRGASVLENITGGPNQEGTDEFITVAGNALIASTPVLTIVPAGTAITKEMLTFTYEIEEGDTLSAIAEDFGVSLETLLWANGLSSRTILKPGDRLTILPIDGVTHTVKSGETISSIAQSYKVDEEEILTANNLNRDSLIHSGDVLVVPGGSPHVPISSQLAPAPSQSLVDVTGYFISPARGRITYGLHRYNAVDLGGRDFCNTPVYAAAAGTVITADDAGWNGGYGKYVKISHPNGTVTLYAHNSQILASVGQYVPQGEVIALMGATGNASGCHVHFEVRGAKNPFAK